MLTFFLSDAMCGAMRNTKRWVQNAIAVEKAACGQVQKDEELRRGTDFLEAITRRDVSDSIRDSPGMRTYERLLETLDQFNVRRSSAQKMFHTKMCRAFIPYLFGDTYTRHETSILKYLGIKRLLRRLLFYTSRRDGKTWSVVMMIAALLYVCDGASLTSVGLSGRVCTQTMRLVRMFFSRLPNSHRRIIRKSAEEFEVRTWSNLEGYTNLFSSLPAQVDTIRGRGSPLMFCDEVAFFPPNVMEEGVYPMMLPQNSAAVFISTPPRGGESAASKWEKAVNERGELIFETVRIQRVCAECELKKMSECPHAELELPHWKSHKQQTDIEALYANSKNKARELHGVEFTDDFKCFDRKHIEAIFLADRYTINGNVSHVFVAADPSGGGITSNTSIIMLIYDSDHRPLVSYTHNAYALIMALAKDHEVG
jgi:hypothetical protein